MFGWLKRRPGHPVKTQPRTDEAVVAAAGLDPPVPDRADRLDALISRADPHHTLRERCRRRLVHSDDDEREGAAWRLGKLGHYGQLGDAVMAVVAELGAVIRRPIEEDSKEVQAIDAAIMALASLGRPEGIPHLAWVLDSRDLHLDGDSQWEAADALGQIIGQNFRGEADPPGAARAWLASRHPPVSEAN